MNIPFYMYFSLNLLFSLTTLVLLIRAILAQRYLIVRPSLWFLIFFHIQIQWSSVVNAGYIYDNLNDLVPVFLLTQVFPFVALIIVPGFFRSACIKTWQKLVESSQRDYNSSYSTLLLLFVPICLVILGIYIFYVPIPKTGLYQSLFGDNALAATLAREDSLKLLPNQWLKYVYQFYSRFLALFVSSVLMVIVINLAKKRKFFFVPLALMGASVILIGASLPGARVTGAMIVLSMLLTFFLQNRLKISGGWLALGLFLVLFPSVMVQLLKHDTGFGLWQIVDGFSVLLERVMFVPLKAGIQWLSYTEMNGFWGVRGIPKLASIFGKDSVNVPNFLMNYYTTSVVTTGFLTTSFVFSYYCFFGIIMLPIYILMILFIDLWVLMYARLAVPFVIPAIVSLNAASINLIGSDYLTMFITYGFFTGAVLIALVSSLLVGRQRVRFKFTKSAY